MCSTCRGAPAGRVCCVASVPCRTARQRCEGFAPRASSRATPARPLETYTSASIIRYALSAHVLRRSTGAACHRPGVGMVGRRCAPGTAVAASASPARCRDCFNHPFLYLCVHRSVALRRPRPASPLRRRSRGSSLAAPLTLPVRLAVPRRSLRRPPLICPRNL